MRPRELTLEGFRSHRARATFDFRGRHLIGVVGPIGSGKSSLLDAVVFALYGKTPTFERDTRSLIHQLADTARVQLVFEVDGQLWRATRAIRRKGQSQHKLERLADDGSETALETVVQEAPVRKRVELLLGMDFAAFCRSVLLAQGRFAEFLKARPRERTDVLKGVFGYERFDAALVAAKERAAHAEGELVALAHEGDQLAEAREQLEEARAAASTAAARHTALEAAKARIEELAAELRRAEAAATAADARRRQLASITDALPTGERIAEVVDGAAHADDDVDAADDASAAATAALAAAEASRDAVADRVGDQSAIEHLVARLEREAAAAAEGAEAAAAASASVAEAEAEAQTRRRERDASVAVQAAAASNEEAAGAAVAAAEAALHEARHAEMAIELRRELTVGDPCPVCAQVVATLPRAARAPKVDAAEAGLQAARRALEEARTAHAAAQKDAASAAARAESAAAEVPRRASLAETTATKATETAAALEATKSELVDRLGEGDPHELAEARRRELEAAEAAVVEARETERVARDAADAARRAKESARERLDEIRASLLTAWGRLGETVEVPRGPTGVRDGFEALGERLVGELAQVDAERQEATNAAGDASTGLAAELAEVGLGPDEDVAGAVGEAHGARVAAQERVAGLEGVLARGSDLEARLGVAVARRDLAKRLVADLQPARFLGFVLEEERRALAELGSVHLDELTNGAFRFTDDDRFDVVDVNAAATVRSADSLSGGETFLASLALALALAEMVARGGGRLDSFFLDEGFGSLDPEHLDRAMDGVARLVAGDADRLVVLVSHVEQMRQTLEDLIVLDKDPRTGDSIVVAGAHPLA